MGCDKYNQNWLTGLGLATKILYHRMTRGNLIEAKLETRIKPLATPTSPMVCNLCIHPIS